MHAFFRSRIMFPVRDRDGRIVGFAGLGTHLGPSWPMWVISPDVGLYRRSEAVFGLDLAARRIASSKTAVVVGGCIEVLQAHQDGRPNAVTVHTGGVTPEQIEAMAAAVRGGESAWSSTWMESGSSPSSIRASWRRPACRRPCCTGSRRRIWS